MNTEKVLIVKRILELVLRKKNKKTPQLRVVYLLVLVKLL